MREHLLYWVLAGEQGLVLFRQKEQYVQSHRGVNNSSILRGKSVTKRFSQQEEEEGRARKAVCV